MSKRHPPFAAALLFPPRAAHSDTIQPSYAVFPGRLFERRHSPSQARACLGRPSTKSERRSEHG